MTAAWEGVKSYTPDGVCVCVCGEHLICHLRAARRVILVDENANESARRISDEKQVESERQLIREMERGNSLNT